MAKNRRSALTYYVNNRPKILEPIIPDPGKEITDADAATGLTVGGLVAFALRSRRLPLISSVRIGNLLSKGLARGGLARDLENNMHTY